MKKHLILSFFGSLLMLSVVVPVAVFAQADVNPNPSTSSCVNLQNNLSYQSRDTGTNGEVSTLQDFLQTKGYLNSEPTGYFGLLTMAAAKSFQAANGIQGDGYVGAITRAKISAMTCGGVSTNPTHTNNLNPNFKNGCFSYYGFSSTTGESCSGQNQTFMPTPDSSSCPLVQVNGVTSHTCLPGCSSNRGFSTTTGQYCDGSHPFIAPPVTTTTNVSSITLFSPNGGDTWHVGESKTISWSTQNIPNTAYIYLTLEGPTSIRIGSLIPVGSLISTNFVLPNSGCIEDICQQLKSGNYKVSAVVYDQNTCIGLCANSNGTTYTRAKVLARDSSDGYITVVANNTTFLPGCTSTYGFSSVNGTACDGSVPSTVVGCTTTKGFSTTTGEYCDGSHPAQPNYLPGCSSIYGWSTTTGQACNGTSYTTPTLITPTVDVKANNLDGPVDVNKGGSVYISWTSTYADSCHASGNVWNSVGLAETLTLKGAVNFVPEISGNYTITCTGPGGSSSDTVQISIGTPNNTTNTSTCSNSGFDSTTGLPCGCTSTLYYSSTTGEPCNGIVSSSFKVLTPAKGDGLFTGETYTDQWSGNENTDYDVYLMKDGGVIGFVGKAYNTAKNINNFTWAVPNNIPSGDYTLSFQAKAAGGSSAVFHITNNTTNTATCPTSVFDPTTGQPCNLKPTISYLQKAGYTTVLAPTDTIVVGGTMYVFGSNFNSNDEILVAGGAVVVPANFISSSSLSFVVPQVSGNALVEVRIHHNDGSYTSNDISNDVYMNVVSN